jgi:hypothetical protein
MKRTAAAIVLFGSVMALALGQPQQTGVQPKPKLPAGHPGAPAAPNWPKPNPDDVKSIDSILAAMQQAIGGAPGQPRDWDRYRSLFAPDARLIAARPGAGSAATAMFLTVENFIDANKAYFEKGGFFDNEVSRRTEEFGNIAHVWSTYESRHKADDPAPYIRGINSIQLLRDGERWWIVNLFWDFERENSPIPERYLRPTSD